MKGLVGRALLITVVLCIGIATGILYERQLSVSDAVLEDYALQNVLSIIGYSHALNRGEVDTMKGLLDLNLNNHLVVLRQHGGVAEGAEFERAKIGTLDMVQRFWQQNPPFKSAKWKDWEATNAERLDYWRMNHAENLKLLEWAANECKQRPELECSKSSSPDR